MPIAWSERISGTPIHERVFGRAFICCQSGCINTSGIDTGFCEPEDCAKDAIGIQVDAQMSRGISAENRARLQIADHSPRAASLPSGHMGQFHQLLKDKLQHLIQLDRAGKGVANLVERFGEVAARLFSLVQGSVS